MSTKPQKKFYVPEEVLKVFGKELARLQVLRKEVSDSDLAVGALIAYMALPEEARDEAMRWAMQNPNGRQAGMAIRRILDEQYPLVPQKMTVSGRQSDVASPGSNPQSRRSKDDRPA